MNRLPTIVRAVARGALVAATLLLAPGALVAATLIVAPGVFVAATLAPTPGVPADDLPYSTRKAITETLEAQVRELLQERNEDDVPFKRGSFSHAFRRIDDLTYEVTFHQDTAGRDRLRTERYRVTVRIDPDGGPGTVIRRELRDSREALVRSAPGDEGFYRFDSLVLEHEGLSVSGAEGSLYTDLLGGELYRITAAAEGMEQRFTPPATQGFGGRRIWSYLADKKPGKLEFDPGRVEITCSAVECESILKRSFRGLRPVDRDELEASLGRRYGEFRDDEEKALRENGFHGFSTPFEPGRRYTAIVLEKKGSDDRLWLLHDTWAGWEVRLGATEYGTFLGYYSEDTLAGGVTPYELERREDRDARDYDLKKVGGTLELALRDHSTLAADLEFHLVARRTLREVPFHVSRLLRGGGRKSQMVDPSLVVNSIRDGSGNELTWVRSGTTGGLVLLPEEVPAGAQLVLRMQFENRGAIFKLGPSYSRLPRGDWLPFLRWSDPIEELDLTIKVPARYKTLGIGAKVEETIDAEIATTRWLARSVSFPTIIFGDYVERSSDIGATRADETPIDVTIHVDRDGMTDWGIRPKQLPALAEQAANALNLYREIFGVEYPHDKLDLVNDPMGFLNAQSPASIVYLGSAAFRGEGTLVSAVGPAAMKSARSLVAHEVGHQWWGGLVTHANERNYWFVESMAEYASALFMEATQGKPDPERGFRAYMHEVERWREQIVHADLFGSVQHAASLNGGAYRAALYAKGPYALHMMRMTFGDEKFFAFLRELTREFAGREIVTRDIERIAERTFGGDMGWFFDQWIRGVGIPEYEVRYTSRRTEDGQHLIRGTLTQRVVIGSDRQELEGVSFRGLATVTVVGKKSKKEYSVRLAVEGPETTFTFRIPERPGKLILNKNGEMLGRAVTVTRDG